MKLKGEIGALGDDGSGDGGEVGGGGAKKRHRNISAGLGHRGFVTPEALEFISISPNLMSCSGHIKDAVTQYRLSSLRLEFFLNTCDHPMSFHSSHWPNRGGLPFMSTGFTADTIDIPVPDPLDLTGPYTPDLSTQVRTGWLPFMSTGFTADTIDIPVPDPLDLTGPYTPDLKTQIPWEKKESRAVFRGKTTKYELLSGGNWGANPRIRLHLMSPAAPHLMDARINAWSKAEQPSFFLLFLLPPILLHPTIWLLRSHLHEAIILAQQHDKAVLRMVEAAQPTPSSSSLPPTYPFDPLETVQNPLKSLCFSFSDLHEAIIWAQQHDKAVLKMVEAANRFADHACTWHGRMLYWALLLVKYQDVMAEPEKVSRPAQLCSKPIVAATGVEKDPASVTCSDPNREKKQPECAFFCAGGIMSPDTFEWLPAESLDKLERVGPK
ncbi:unnamed protein product [Closterium sp. NIES-65]|nr:unnamed protein product [Closterium sp. NIES-65]